MPEKKLCLIISLASSGPPPRLNKREEVGITCKSLLLLSSLPFCHVPFVGVFDEQAGQQRLGVRGQRARELDVLHEYEFKQLLVVLVVEWQASTHHLVRHHTQTPPVHRPAVVIVLQDLQGEMEEFPK